MFLSSPPPHGGGDFLRRDGNCSLAGSARRQCVKDCVGCCTSSGLLDRYSAENCGLTHWRGSAPRLPLGEAVATIGASEPIVVTDEGNPAAQDCRNAPFSVLPGLPSSVSLSGCHLPPGEGFGAINYIFSPFPFFRNLPANVRNPSGLLLFLFHFGTFCQKSTIFTNLSVRDSLLCEFYKKVGKSLIFRLILRKLSLTIGTERIWVTPIRRDCV